ncbi:MFS transporter [Phaeacidiphilus oryzae]|uniref:MFS transporter n=1 Tax=Phaeacidiphilus oryzae TaxID=348818 RepID=UPI000A5C28C1|nr:MFS transporter [Phaeacidiphilus oryzae]
MVAASAMGNAIEWFDYGVYGYLATTAIGHNFFPSHDSAAQLLATYGVLAVSFLIRPFGGMFFGPLGDRIGRQKVLVLTITLMSLSTAAIGVLPSYAAIGAWAPGLLILCRLVQGFSTGGEYGGAATYMAEYAPDKKRGFYGSFLEFGTLIGLTAGGVMATVMDAAVGEQTLDSWGWRIPFLVALPLGAIGLYLRARLEDSPVFEELAKRSETSKAPFKETMQHWRPILLLMGFVLLLNITDYGVLTYMPGYLKTALKMSTLSADLLPVFVMIGMLIVISPIGHLTDRIGRKPALLTSCIGFIVLSIPMLLLMQQHNLVATAIGLAVLGLLLVIMLACIASTLPALFPTQVRYGAFAIGYNVSTSLFGGTAPLVITALMDATGIKIMPGIYMTAAGLIALIPILLMPETAGSSLRGRRVPGAGAQKSSVSMRATAAQL